MLLTFVLDPIGDVVFPPLAFKFELEPDNALVFCNGIVAWCSKVDAGVWTGDCGDCGSKQSFGLVVGEAGPTGAVTVDPGWFDINGMSSGERSSGTRAVKWPRV